MAVHIERGPSDRPPPAPPSAPRSPVASLRVAAAGLAIIAGLGLGVVIGRASVPSAKTNAAQPAAAPHVDARAEMAARNNVWRMLNDINTDPGDSLDTQTKVVGVIVAAMLDPASTSQNRGLAISLFVKKSARYFSDAEMEQIDTDLTSGTPEQIRAAFTKIVMADKQADDLLSSVLADTDRINRYMHGQPIPLEKMPDGSTP